MKKTRRSKQSASQQVAPAPIDVMPGITDASASHHLPGQLTEALHYLVAKYQLVDEARLPSPLAVVSSLHGEGVTTLSQGLAAIVAADLDTRVCWVDLSWTGAPSTRRTNKSDASPGIVDLLTHRAVLADVLEKTGDDRLQLLRPGPIPEAQRRAIARSGQLVQIVKDVAAMFPYVILDIPPVLASSESLSMLRLAQAQLLVVRYGVTTTQQVRQVANEIDSVPSVGVVLNQFSSRIPSWLTRFIAP